MHLSDALYLVSSEQLEMFQRNFNELIADKSESKSGLNKDQFTELMHLSHIKLDVESANKLFDVFILFFIRRAWKTYIFLQYVDSDKNGSIDFKEIICFLSTLSSNSVEDRVKRKSITLKTLQETNISSLFFNV
jgi:hypothetical protein